MKRSEMLDLMEEEFMKMYHEGWLYDSGTGGSAGVSDRDIVNRFLTLIENQGMLPPDTITDYDQAPDGNWYPYELNIWEPEDE